ncbi:MAG TPA: endonuclease/exonuclease/phosphatase family protein [Gammaproteobacteria bacterium]|nr:endonuclease/exonuclease/phosphatase family protein [Gammaproteobacteria bacterium]
MRIVFRYKKTFAVASAVATGSVLVSGCVAVPEQTLIVKKELDKNRSISINNCDIEQAQFNSDKKRQGENELDANNITILNWNIYKGEKRNWAKDFRQLSNGKDLVIIQEARLTSEVKETLKKQSIHWTLNTGFYVNDEATGVLTGSRVKPVSSCGLRTTEPFLRLPKTVLVNEYDLSGTDERLLVANIHSINFTLGTKVYGKQIDELKAAINNHQGPVIVAGDFNSWSDGRKEIVDNMVADLSLKAVTYKSKNRITIFGNEIDHVFYRGLESVASEAKQVTSSDHNPIRVTFRVPPDERKVAQVN